MTTIHQVTTQSFRRSLAAGIHSLAHLPNDQNLTESDIGLLLEAKKVLEPTASVLYYLCWKIKTDELEKHMNLKLLTDYRNDTYQNVSQDFWLDVLHKRFAKGFQNANGNRFRLMGVDASPLFRVYARSALACFTNLGKLYKAGVPLACGNDAGAVCSTPAMVTHELEVINLGLTISEGLKLDNSEALRIATLNSAKALGIEKDFGSIIEGKIADLVVLKEDPLKDYKVLGTKADALFMGGRLVLDRMELRRGVKFLL